MSSGQNDGEGFARRWSRLKRQDAASAPVAPAMAPAEPASEPVTPPPAEIVPIDEIVTWVRKGAPEAWAQVALRRLWTSDPAIRTHIGLADYAWDWNVPGGVPGWGPMRAIDDVARLLARAIGEPMQTEPATLEPRSDDLGEPAASFEPRDPAMLPPMVQVSNEPESRSAAPPETVPPAAHRRRGGRATPV